MKAIMLAAGEGSRCYPFSCLSPKICQQVAGIPIFEFMLSWFGGTPAIDKLYVVLRDDSDVEHVTRYVQMREQYLYRIIELFNRLGYKVEYSNPSLEIEAVKASGWGTGGDLKLTVKQIVSHDKLGDDFLVCNADYVTIRKLPDGGFTVQLNLTDVIRYHRKCKDELGIAVTLSVVGVDREEATRFGVAITEKVRDVEVIRGFMEKPQMKDIPDHPRINAGVYVFDGDFFMENVDRFLPEGPDVSLEKMMLERLAQQDQPLLAAYSLELARWFDVGTLEQLVDASIHIVSKEGLK